MLVMGMYIIEECLSSSVENACAISKYLVKRISEFITNERILYNLRLVITELVVNGVEHGNNGDFTKKVHVCVVINKGKVIITVKDQGVGVNSKKDNNEINRSDTSGRGLFIVEKLTDKLTFNENEIVAELNI